MAKLAILTWKYLYLLNVSICNFLKPLLTWVMIKIVVPSVTTLTLPMIDLQLLSLVQRLRRVHHSQPTSISYTFLVADYWSSTATLSYKDVFDTDFQWPTLCPPNTFQTEVWSKTFFSHFKVCIYWVDQHVIPILVDIITLGSCASVKKRSTTHPRSQQSRM